MDDPIDRLRRHAEWQKSRAKLSWSEKLRLAEVLRDAAIALRRSERAPATTSCTSTP